MVGAIAFVLGVLALLFFGQWRIVESTTVENYQGSVVNIEKKSWERYAQLTLLSDDGALQKVEVNTTTNPLPFGIKEHKASGEGEHDRVTCDVLVIDEWLGTLYVSSESKNCTIHTTNIQSYVW